MLSLPTTGPVLLSSLLSQDMYLAGSIILITGMLTVIGTLCSDFAAGLARPASASPGLVLMPGSSVKDPTIEAVHPGRPVEEEELPLAEGVAGDGDEKFQTASQSVLVWRAFRRHRFAVIGAVITVFLYVVVLFAEFFAPFTSSWFHDQYPYAPPQRIHVIDRSSGETEIGLYVYGYTQEVDQESLAVRYTVDTSKKIPIRLFDTSAEPYKMLGFIPANVHLIGPVNDDDPMYLLGADRVGRDLLSRITFGTRMSMTIGLVGVSFAFVLGVVLGGISGYFSGKIDTVIQRVVELFMSIPTLPLWLGLAAAMPSHWGGVERYFAITTILALFAWTRPGAGDPWPLPVPSDGGIRHLCPAGRQQTPARDLPTHGAAVHQSHLIASLTLALPAMILAETALSFLGLGLQPPVVSWGVLLQEAQNVRVVAPRLPG